MIIPPIYTALRPFHLVSDKVKVFLSSPNHHVLFILSSGNHFSLLWMYSDDLSGLHSKYFDSLTLQPQHALASHVASQCGITTNTEAITPYVQVHSECGIFAALAAATLAAEMLNAEGKVPDHSCVASHFEDATARGIRNQLDTFWRHELVFLSNFFFFFLNLKKT